LEDQHSNDVDSDICLTQFLSKNWIQVLFTKANTMLKFLLKGKGGGKAKAILIKKNEIGRISLCDFNIYYSYSNWDCVVMTEGCSHRSAQ
jgi:hypothetical protein